MDLPLATRLSIGIQTIHRRTEPATAPWLPRIDELVALVELVDRCGYDSLWVGDHIAFAVPILDPLLTLAQAAVVSRRLILATGVYLLPLRHPGPVAKQIATLDHLTEGRLIFGVGVGGEFPKEFEACGVPIAERGARLSEGITVLRQLWTGKTVSHGGRFFAFDRVQMLPPPRQPGGPPIWCGGRSDAALRRAGRLADGWISYVVTPEMYKARAEQDRRGSRGGWAQARQLRHRASAICSARRQSYEKALDAATRYFERALRDGFPASGRALCRPWHGPTDS